MEKIFKSGDDKDKIESDVEASGNDIVTVDREKLLPDKESTTMTMPMLSSPSIWDRNFQLAFFSMILMLVILVLSNTMSQSADSTTGPFKHWSIYATILTLLQGGGGLLAAATLKYTNANLKTLATTLSIVFSTILEFCLMGLHLNLPMIVGILTIIASISSFTIKTTH
jgi:drug/metabolite transporter (DMT)-like permease